MTTRVQQLEEALIVRIITQRRIDEMPSRYHLEKAEDYPFLYGYLKNRLDNSGLKIRACEEMMSEDGFLTRASQ